MRIAPLCLCLLFLLPVHLPAAATTACADEPLRLNEFMAGPARDWDGNGVFSSRDDEWVEVVNMGATPLDLTGYLVTDRDSIPRMALGGTLAPGAHLVVTGGEAYAWEQANGRPAVGLSLANSGDAVLLWRVVAEDTLLVDSHDYRSHEAAADRSVGRAPDGTGEWVVFDSLNPYTGTTPPPGNGCPPTPGLENVCDTTPARRVPWGRIKGAYR